MIQVNNGVYKSGFATTQGAYARAQRELYEALDTIEQRLSQHRFLVGDRCAHLLHCLPPVALPASNGHRQNGSVS